MSGLSPSSLLGLRTCLRSEFADVPGEHLEEVVTASMSDLPQPVAENFLKSLGSLGKTVAPVLQRAAPGIAQGAASGASVGGPWGALIGAGVGLASSASKGAKPARPAAPTMSPMGGTVGGTAAAAPVPALPTGQPAAATLVSLLQNPSVLQALMSQVLGASGTPQVATATGTSLPRGAINGLLMQLLANASEGLVESDQPSEQSYLQDDLGEYLIDPASSEQQAAVVLSHLQPEGVAGFALPPVDFAEGELTETEFTETGEWMADEDDAEAEPWTDSDDSTETVRFY
jgi:hypothetical protein